MLSKSTSTCVRASLGCSVDTRRQAHTFQGNLGCDAIYGKHPPCESCEAPTVGPVQGFCHHHWHKDSGRIERTRVGPYSRRTRRQQRYSWDYLFDARWYMNSSVRRGSLMREAFAQLPSLFAWLMTSIEMRSTGSAHTTVPDIKMSRAGQSLSVVKVHNIRTRG